MTYKWKMPYFKTDANEAAAELDRISKKYGSISAKAIVDESRDEDAVLHKEFEWNDEVAAEKYREHQASVIVCNIVVAAEEEKQEDFVAVRAFVHTPNGFKNIKTVLQTQEDRDYMFDKALEELNDFKRKYAAIREFEKLFSTIEELNGIERSV